MRYGFYLPTRGPTATRDGILALAREGERKSTYPYTLDGKHPSTGDVLETFSILGVVAGATERCGSSPRCWYCPTAIRC
jgi:hypothetical protein